jgi:hypothetical protein
MKQYLRRCGWIGPILAMACIAWAAPVGGIEAAELHAATVAAWNRYVQATERRIADELASPDRFLAMDFQSEGEASAERQGVAKGEILAFKMITKEADGTEIKVPDGMIHHWRGSVFVRGATLEEVLARVANPVNQEIKQEDVLESRVLERSPDALKLFLKLQRSKLVTVVYNTEHQVHYYRYGPARAASRSIATRIAEVEHPFSGAEREKPQGHDRGFLWRLNSYWRYEQIDGGIVVECESISLSRTVPFFLAYLIRPLIDKVARESMQRTLGSTRQRLMRAGKEVVSQTSFHPLQNQSRLSSASWHTL